MAPGLLSPALAQPKPFDRSIVRQMARDLASKPYKAPTEKLPDNLAKIDYDHYRAIRFLPERALWRGEKLAVRGAVLSSRIFLQEPGRHLRGEGRPGLEDRLSARAVFVRRAGAARPRPSISALPAFGSMRRSTGPTITTRSASFSARAISAPSPRARLYGLSARGLVDQHRRSQGRGVPVLQGVLDREAGSQAPTPSSCMRCSTARARRRPIASPSGPATPPSSTSKWRSIRASDLEHAGLAPMTSMFFFGPNDRKDVDDFRPAVHDSDGLAICNGRGEELWRPLHNPRDLQVSAFADLNPRGFGLMQRQRDFLAYQDLESQFRAPAEPVGRADRRLGRRRGQADRDPDQGRDPRQHRRVLAAQGAAAGQGRAHLHLSPALGAGCAEADLAGAIFPNRHRRARRQRARSSCST